MSRARVAYLIDSLGAGGSERSLAETLPHLTAAGIEARIFVLSQPRQGFDHLVRDAGIELEPVPAGLWPKRCAHLRRRLREWRPDVLHTTLFYSDVLGRLAAWRTGIPVVSSLVSLRYESERFADPRVARWRFRVLQAIDRWTGRRLAAHFQAVSQAAKDSAIATLGLRPDSITVVRRGRDVGRFAEPDPARRADERRRWHVTDDELLIANVGRQTFHKAQLILLEAVRELLGVGLPVRAVIAGSHGPCTRELLEFVERHELGGTVRLAGHIDDVPGLLAAADVFAFPSRLEGFPGAVLEAMAASLPVVAADIAPIREIFAQVDGALLFERDSVAGLRTALERLIEDPRLRRSLGERNRAAFLERYDVRQTVPQLVDLYLGVAGAR